VELKFKHLKFQLKIRKHIWHCWDIIGRSFCVAMCVIHVVCFSKKHEESKLWKFLKWVSFFSLHFFIYLSSLKFIIIIIILNIWLQGRSARRSLKNIWSSIQPMTIVNMWDDQGCRSCCTYGTLVLISCSSNEFSRPYVIIAINWDPHLWLEIWKLLKHFNFKNKPHSNNMT